MSNSSTAQLDRIIRIIYPIVGQLKFEFSEISWQVAAIKFFLAISILWILTASRLMKRVRQRVIQLSVIQLLAELSLVWAQRVNYVENDVIALFWLRTNAGWLTLTLLILLTALIKSLGCGIHETDASLTKSDLRTAYESLEEKINLRRRDDDREFLWMTQMLMMQMQASQTNIATHSDKTEGFRSGMDGTKKRAR